jgi:hypothetical protein
MPARRLVTDAILCSCAVQRVQAQGPQPATSKEYDRLADHVGRYPVVMITPYDGQLVLEGSARSGGGSWTA